jgi:hypothetical protein
MHISDKTARQIWKHRPGRVTKRSTRIGRRKKLSITESPGANMCEDDQQAITRH